MQNVRHLRAQEVGRSRILPECGTGLRLLTADWEAGAGNRVDGAAKAEHILCGRYEVGREMEKIISEKRFSSFT